MSPYRFGLVIILLIMMLSVALGLAASLGSSPIPVFGLIDPQMLSPVDRTILFELRLPRVALAAMVGAALSTAGTAFQCLFRNPLADPFVMGASSGAALGATAAILLGWDTSAFGLAPVPLAAFAGTLVAVITVYGVGGLGPRASPLTLLLAGAAVSSMLGAVVSLAMLLHDESLHAVFAWLLGGLASRGWPEVITVAGFAAPAILILVAWARPLDALTFGDQAAQSLGLSVWQSRMVIVAAASLATAAAVATTGLIGFVGLIAPHSMRLLVGAGHARLVPAAALAGAILLVAADTASRVIAAPLEIPVGILTALMGGPFFLALLRTRLTDGRGDL
jgi:iron complex transport system permease protein